MSVAIPFPEYRKLLLLASVFCALVMYSVESSAQMQRYIVTIRHTSSANEAAKHNAIWAPGLKKAYAQNSNEVGSISALQDHYLAEMDREIKTKVPTGRRSGFSRTSAKFSHFSALLISPNSEEVEVIRSHPHTASIVAEGVTHVALNQAGIVSHFETTRNLGNAGAGQVLAVIDTTFQVNHPMLNGKVDAEACFSSGGVDAGVSYFGLCPNGNAQQIGAGSSGNFGACAQGSGCRNHGTHVASAAAGAIVNAPTGGNMSGVARNAHLITVTAASRNATGNAERFFDGDLLAALNWVYSQKLIGRNIAAVNISVGSTATYSNDCDSAFPAFANAYQALLSVGVSPVVSSGNSGVIGGIAFPSCLSGAISVGASLVADTGFSSFSNISAFTTIVAVGGLTAAIPTSAYLYMPGTSMAAPQVAGAVAVLRSNYPSADPAGVKHALRSGTTRFFTYSGPGAYDYCGTSVCNVPRLDVQNANDNFISLTFGGGF